MNPLFRNPYIEKKPVKNDHYFSVELTPELMLALGDLLEGKKVTEKTVMDLKDSWCKARRTQLKYATLPWEQLSYEAKRQGCTEVDVLWDLAKGKDPD